MFTPFDERGKYFTKVVFEAEFRARISLVEKLFLGEESTTITSRVSRASLPKRKRDLTRRRREAFLQWVGTTIDRSICEKLDGVSIVGKGDMIDMESQRQVLENSDFCPESCSFCPGVGLSNSIWSESHGFVSCSTWQNHGLERIGSSSEVVIPSKLFSGISWKKVFKNLSDKSQIIVPTSRLDFDPEILNRVLDECNAQVWVVPERGVDVLLILRPILEKHYDKIFFYCPLYSFKTDKFLTSQELVRLFRKLKKHFKGLEIRPPRKTEIYNSTLTQEFYAPNEEILVDGVGEKEVDVSVIIPSYNNQNYVNRVVRNLKNQYSDKASFEVIVVDDGSSDQTIELLNESWKQGLVHENFRLIHFPRNGKREMGDFYFRAGVARNLGVKHSCGKILAFLDSDMVVPPDYIQRLYVNHLEEGHDVVQIQRLYLKDQPSKNLISYDSIDKKDDVFHPEGGYWRDFFSDQREWDHIPSKWKYVCTYGLSVTATKYHGVGGFRSVFNSYGFEDTDLGYRLYKAGARFHKSSIEAYHLWQDTSKSEFSNSPWKRQKLLNRSANIFFRHNLDEEVFKELESLMVENRTWRNRFKIRRKK